MSKSESIFSKGRSLYLIHGIAVSVFVLAIAITQTGLYTTILNLLDRNFLFRARHAMHLNPQSSPKLKILGLDDATAAMLGEPTLTGKDMFLLLKNISDKKPKAILIDGLLGRAPGEEALKLWKQRGQLEEVHSGLFLSPKKIPYRAPFDGAGEIFKAEANGYPPTTFLENWMTFSYNPEYKGMIGTPGHINYFQDGVLPLFLNNNANTVFPHISLYAADSFGAIAGDLFINQRKVQTDNGNIIINYRNPRTYYKKTRSLRFLINRARDGIPEKSINEGDIVLLILGYATGTTDFIEGTPFGHIPGGLLIASTIDDILLGTFLTNGDLGVLPILILGLAAAYFGIKVSPRQQWKIGLGIISIYVGISLALFCSYNIVVPFSIPIFTFLIINVCYSAHRGLIDEIQTFMLEKEFYDEKTLRRAEETEKKILANDLSQGRVSQELLLPKKMHGDFSGLSYTMSLTPHLQMSGDWLYHWSVNDDETRIILGDVAGKGAGAAMAMAAIISCFRQAELQNMSLERALESTNNMLLDLFKGQAMSTATSIILAKRDSGKTEIKLYNAGGPGWFLINKGSIKALSIRGTPLGISKTIQTPHKSVTLEEGNMLTTFSDGYAEGSREIRNIRNKMKDVNPEKISHHQFIDIILTANENRYGDDQTILTIVA